MKFKCIKILAYIGPDEKTCQQTWETMNNLTNKQNNLSVNYKFHIPDLKVGTLDQLVGLSDDLGKLDGFVEQVTRKVAQYLGEVLEDQRDKLQENLMANNSHILNILFPLDYSQINILKSNFNLQGLLAVNIAVSGKGLLWLMMSHNMYASLSPGIHEVLINIY
ncbi:hypothetical protein NQ317_006885 [Molorchus minor]|uniref:V-type proton ATPase subunit C n=1 Tax=Molorchus minor TaxID=1323400 RepID=A0ABQ9JL38_9CUCU|nr:hypothetical protein NQ317_006885 [Molorchus minor]